MDLKDLERRQLEKLAGEAKRVNSMWQQYQNEFIAIACATGGIGLMVGVILGYVLHGCS